MTQEGDFSPSFFCMKDKEKIVRLESQNKVLRQMLADIKKRVEEAEELIETKPTYFAYVKNPFRGKG